MRWGEERESFQWESLQEVTSWCICPLDFDSNLFERSTRVYKHSFSFCSTVNNPFKLQKRSRWWAFSLVLYYFSVVLCTYALYSFFFLPHISFHISFLLYWLRGTTLQIFYSFFKTLVGKRVAVELKNDVAIMGTLVSISSHSCFYIGKHVYDNHFVPPFSLVLGSFISMQVSVDQYLNIKLMNISVINEERYPQLVCSSVLLLSVYRVYPWHL